MRGRATIHVIVTCSNQKSRPIPARLQLGQVPGPNAAQRARRWISRLTRTSSTPQIPARDLYAGEHWSVARNLPALHRPGEEIRLWACSAGYGLIPSDAPIMPYHATLTPGQADSVPGAVASWWSVLSEWQGQSSFGLGFCRRSTATSWRSTSSSASFGAAERAGSASQPCHADEHQVEHPYRHKTAILPALGPPSQPYSPVSNLCPVLEPHRHGRRNRLAISNSK